VLGTTHIEAQIRQVGRVRTGKDHGTIRAVVVRGGASGVERSNHDIVDKGKRSTGVGDSDHAAGLLGAIADGVATAVELPVAGAEVVVYVGVGEGAGVLGGVDETEVLEICQWKGWEKGNMGKCAYVGTRCVVLESCSEDRARERCGDVLEERRAARWGAGVPDGEAETDEAVGLTCCERV